MATCGGNANLTAETARDKNYCNGSATASAPGKCDARIMDSLIAGMNADGLDPLRCPCWQFVDTFFLSDWTTDQSVCVCVCGCGVEGADWHPSRPGSTETLWVSFPGGSSTFQWS